MTSRLALAATTLAGFLLLLPQALAAPPCGTDAVCDQAGDAPPTLDVRAAWIENIEDGHFDVVLEVDDALPVGPAVSLDEAPLYIGAASSYVAAYCFDPRGQDEAGQVCYSVWATPTVTGWRAQWFARSASGDWHCPPPGPTALEAFAVVPADENAQFRWRVTASLHDLHAPPPETCGPVVRGTVGSFVGGAISCLEAFTTTGASAGITGLFTLADEAGGCKASPAWNVKP